MKKEQKRFLRFNQVKYQVGLGRTAIYAGIKAGTFPKPYSLGIRAVAWLSEDIETWIESRIKAAGVAK